MTEEECGTKVEQECTTEDSVESEEVCEETLPATAPAEPVCQDVTDTVCELVEVEECEEQDPNCGQENGGQQCETIQEEVCQEVPDTIIETVNELQCRIEG